MDKDRGGNISTKEISAPTIKQEPNDDIKNYAETTMNELLGWYGYDGVSSMETEHLNLTKFRSSSKDKRRIERKTENELDDVSDDSIDSLPDDESVPSSEQGETSLAAQHRNLVSALTKRQGTSPGSSDSPPSPQYIVCAWCQKPGLKFFTLKSPSGVKPFCSELCFTQCRRASFKKNKICDWCKHVRHTVNYVEFQDGDIQYQFCSEKCLSQYKMNIFCRETQEHLNKIKSKGSEENNNCDLKEKHILITPELWLKEANEDKSLSEKKANPLSDESDTMIKKPRIHERKSTITSEGNDIFPVKLSASRSTDGKMSTEKSREKSSSRTNTVMSDSRDSLSATSPSSNSQISPKPQHLPPLPSTSAYMSPSPWMAHHPILNGLGPGMLNPLLCGIMGPYGPLPSSTKDTKPDNRPPSSPNLCPNSASPATSTGTMESNPSAPFPRPIPPFFPMGYPPFPYPQFSSSELPYSGGMLTIPPPQPSHPLLNNPLVGSSTPPVTVMVPFPVVLPVPVPIPLPLPITAEKLEKFFKDKAQEEANKKQTSNTLSRPRQDDLSRSRSAEPNKQEPGDACLQCASCNNGTARASCRSADVEHTSRQSSFSDMYSHKLKRSLTPNISTVFSKKQKVSMSSAMRSDSDGAMDLSKDSRKDHLLQKENNKKDSSQLISDKVDNEYMLKVPRIHIVNTETTSQTLGQSLPLPPAENNYSNRRSLILDAPNVPKKEQSPSPERRYVRTVSRDMVDAARRRCLRARVKTK